MVTIGARIAKYQQRLEAGQFKAVFRISPPGTLVQFCRSVERQKLSEPITTQDIAAAKALRFTLRDMISSGEIQPAHIMTEIFQETSAELEQAQAKIKEFEQQLKTALDTTERNEIIQAKEAVELDLAVTQERIANLEQHFEDTLEILKTTRTNNSFFSEQIAILTPALAQAKQAAFRAASVAGLRETAATISERKAEKLSEQIRQKDQKIAALDQELEQLKSKLSDKKSIARLQIQQQSQLEQQRTQAEQLKEELEAEKTARKELREQYKQAQEELTRLRAEKAEAARIANLALETGRALVKKLEEELAQAREELAQAQTAAEAADKRALASTTKMATAQRAATEAKEEVSRLKNELEATLAALTEAERPADTQATPNEMPNYLADLIEVKRELQGKVDQAQHEAAEKEAALAEARQEATAAEQTLAETEQELSQLQDKFAAYIKETQQIKRELLGVQQKLGQAQQELTEARNKASRLDIQLTAKTEELSKALEEKEQAEGQANKLKTEAERLNRKIETIQGLQKNLTEEREATLNELLEQKRSLNDQLVEAKRATARAEQAAAAAQREIETIREETERELQEINDKADQELEERNKTIEAKEKEITALEEKLEELKNAHQADKTLLKQRLEGQITTLKAELEAAKEAPATIEAVVQSAGPELQQLQTENTGLKESVQGWYDLSMSYQHLLGIEQRLELYGESTADSIEKGDGFAIGTNIGTNKARTTNEDSVGYLKLADGREVFVVSDGMGGHEAGEIASRIITQAFLDAVATGHTLYDAVVYANRKLIEELGQEKSGGKGATLVAAILDRKNKRLKVVHVGDSRAKFVGKDTSLGLTKDHTVKNLLAEKGHKVAMPVPFVEEDLINRIEPAVKALQIGQEEISSSITTVSTNHTPNLITVSEFELADAADDSTFLLYSDGAIDRTAKAKKSATIHPEQLLSTIARGCDTAEKTVTEIIKAARPASPDNISVIAVKLPYTIKATLSADEYEKGKTDPPISHLSAPINTIIPTLPEDQIQELAQHSLRLQAIQAIPDATLRTRTIAQMSALANTFLDLTPHHRTGVLAAVEHSDQFTAFAGLSEAERAELLALKAQLSQMTPDYIKSLSLDQQLRRIGQPINPEAREHMMHQHYFTSKNSGLLKKIRKLRNNGDAEVKIGADLVCLEWAYQALIALVRAEANQEWGQHEAFLKEIRKADKISPDLATIANDPKYADVNKKARSVQQQINGQ